MSEQLMEVVIDERVGCVAVYYGLKQDCLDGFERDDRCLFFARGTWDPIRREWFVEDCDLVTARTVFDLAKRLAAAEEREAKALKALEGPFDWTNDSSVHRQIVKARTLLKQAQCQGESDED